METLNRIEYVRAILSPIVSSPDKLFIEEEYFDDKSVLIHIDAAKYDLGKVIGAKGATAIALRTLLNALGRTQGIKLDVYIGQPKKYEQQRTILE